MIKFATLFIFCAIVALALFFYSLKQKASLPIFQTNDPMFVDEGVIGDDLNELSIEKLRQGRYSGSDIVVEETLAPGSNYKRYIVSYKSEGLKIYALLTVPMANPPEGGFPAIVFNHGYIQPSQYRTTEKYVAYTDVFSRNGYVLIRPDYRGHGNSEGTANGAYGSSAYTIDVLNAVQSVKKYPGVNGEKIGMWGHSMGGHITLRNMVIGGDVKAGVIWAGVVGSYPDLMNNWRRSVAFSPPPLPSGARRWRQVLTEKYGTPGQNPTFWDSISANSYLSDISGALQLHHGTGDSSVPFEFSKKLEEQMKAAGREVELYLYKDDDHNLSSNFSLAAKRSVEFFDKYLK